MNIGCSRPFLSETVRFTSSAYEEISFAPTSNALPRQFLGSLAAVFGLPLRVYLTEKPLLLREKDLRGKHLSR